ncbi:SpvB/TcaC N-terminal domain-containing protein [Zobellia nedashkovskayae]|uniref:SpvB/TcaC N-terminal domain-containing protein n=1 Tax=Zobellia nedashkovskayae TaxID=2779510 RepID=UPI00188BB055|nr:SpvB/TcaC N-terminal domain-containing protein [Zobellia nedashkovskayae]
MDSNTANNEPNNVNGQSQAFGNSPNGETRLSTSVQLPEISLPNGGGAIKGIEDKFKVNAVTGTSSLGIPIPLSPSRNGFMPSLGLSYNSGAGNGAFGLGWGVGLPGIARKTEKELPKYKDEIESDTFVISGAEDLIPVLEEAGGNWSKTSISRSENGIDYAIFRYRPRIEGSFIRIERWVRTNDGDTHWRTVTPGNIHSYYGLTDESRISNPLDSSKVFEWKLCRSHDDKGSITIYLYKKEDFVGVDNRLSEKNRINKCTQLYIKKVCYGVRQPYYLDDDVPQEDDFLFKVVFDYGEHDTTFPPPKDINQEKNNWSVRKDPFSFYRAGFEIRTYRICSRVLMFHCFDILDLPHKPYLTKSLELFYEENLILESTEDTLEGFSYLVKARHNGHLWDSNQNHYSTKHLPDFIIQYQQHEWDTTVQKVSKQNATNAPVGIRDSQYLWVDLFSEGIAGILTEQTGGWFYKSNLGNGDFSKAQRVAPKPSFEGISSGKLAIMELESNGIKSLVSYTQEPKGFFKLTPEEEWEPFKSFSSLPKIDLNNPNMRPLDLNGDGLADLLITEENTLRWYPGAGEKGFEVSKTAFKAIDEEQGPAIIFKDDLQSIFLADMSGDGLTDIVRIRNREICYWPNLGYGHFGAKVNMENSPHFDHPDSFNPNFLRLADIDGSGIIDIIYLGKNDFRVWMNQSGNSWTSTPQIIDSFPHIDTLADVMVLDFLGSGTACIVYSSTHPKNSQQPLQFIDLMGSKKPSLMMGYENNMGKEVSIQYKSSTHFYLEDKKEGRKWITKLPFPVHCVWKMRSEDKIRETVFTSSYRYCHGYFDPYEREYRGFARVEQLDTEDFSQFKVNEARNVVEEDLHQPPVKTVSWFHNGALINRDKMLHQLKEEYFINPSFTECELPEILIKDSLDSDVLREAMRTCKGLPLRSEVYANDGTDKSEFPYSASNGTFEITLVQPKGENKHACFQVIPSESISYNYDRNPEDPRISHSFVLETDNLGNVLKNAAVVYPRVKRPLAPNQVPDKVWQEQNKHHIVYNESDYTDDIIEDQVYRLRTSFEGRSYEINGIPRPADFYYTKDALFDQIKTASTILFEEDFTVGIQKRLSSHGRSYFLKDDLSGPLPLGELSKLGIGHKSYQLAFTKELVSKYYGTKVNDAMLFDAKYVHSEGDEHWWTQGGIPIYADNPKNNFYMPIGGEDVFGNQSTVEFDMYHFLVKSTSNALGHTISAIHDYRTLGAVMMTDINLNRAAVETDELGMVIKSAVMGKEGAGEGDTLADPTARMEYDLFNWQNNQKPNYVHSFVREKHGPDNPRWQESYVYSDGGGGVIMAKAQAEPGIAKHWNSTTQEVEDIDADPRWVGNGRTMIDNKGNTIKAYDPYFSTTHDYESEDALVETGFSPINYYDPIGRNIRTDNPNGTFVKVEFDAWHSKSFDVNDTVIDSQWYIDRGSPDPIADPEPNDQEQRAAWLAAKHYNTPSIAHSDSLGRSFFSITDYGNGKTTQVFSETDLAGRYAKTFDQMERMVSEGYSNLMGVPIYRKSPEKGERWTFLDVMGRLVKIWDNDLQELRTTYDELHRPLSTFSKQGANEYLFNHLVYGDLLPDAIDKNMMGVPYQVYNQAGVVTVKKVDFKGNAVEVDRILSNEYKQIINWQPLAGLTDIAEIQAASTIFLENETFTSSTVLDALNRPLLTTLPDGSIIEPSYNEANMLETLNVQVRGQGNFISFLQNQDYDANGQRQFAEYGNGLITNYFYDPKTFRLINLITKTNGDADSNSHQNLKYTFDPMGNIVHSQDDAQQTHYFNNTVIKAENKFEYDAIYQLKSATGREHAGLGGNAQRNREDLPFLAKLPHSNNASAVRNYTERYQYDNCGNILQMRHSATNANWTRRYQYAYQNNPLDATNRLAGTSIPSDPITGPYSETYQHDLHGNMTKMPHLNELVWNFMDQLKEVDLGGGGKAYYVYGSGGNRMRKVIERSGGKRVERIYLGGVEIYREYQGNSKRLERSTVHVSDNTGRIAQVDTKTLDLDNSDVANPLGADLIRYQYSNHLDSATLETDDRGTVISYEEYHPYGTSAYRSSKSDVDLSLKRYRFSGKERDDETGLYYFGARYYAAWLGRWTSSDPAGFVDGLNTFNYVSNKPINKVDPLGEQEEEPSKASDKSKDVAGIAKEAHRKVVSVQTNVLIPAKVLKAFRQAKEVIKGNNELRQELKTMSKTLRKLDNRIKYSGGGKKVQAQARELKKAITSAKELLQEQKGAVKEANKLIQGYKEAAKELEGLKRLKGFKKFKAVKALKAGVLSKVGDYALKFEKVLATTKSGRAVLKYGKVLAHPAVQKGLMVVGAVTAGVHSYVDSTNTTEAGKIANAITGGATGTLVLANPVVAVADHFAPEGYKVSEVYHGGSNAVTSIAEGLVTGNTKSMDDFHTRSKKGDFGKVMKVSSEAGDFWAEEGISGGLKQFGKEIWSLF